MGALTKTVAQAKLSNTEYLQMLCNTWDTNYVPKILDAWRLENEPDALCASAAYEACEKEFDSRFGPGSYDKMIEYTNKKILDDYNKNRKK